MATSAHAHAPATVISYVHMEGETRAPYFSRADQALTMLIAFSIVLSASVLTAFLGIALDFAFLTIISGIIASIAGYAIAFSAIQRVLSHAPAKTF